VLVFFLISGYFETKETFKVSKFLRLVLEVLFYIALWALVLSLTNEIKWSYSSFKDLFTHYWFIHTYLVVMVLSPFLVKLGNIMNKKQFLFLFAGVVLLGEIMTYVLKTGYSSLLYASLGFMVGYYLRKYGLVINWKWRLCGIVSFALGVGLHYLTLYLNTNNGTTFDINAATEYSSPLMLIAGVALLLEFVSFKPFTCPFLNEAASGVFGVYLLHDFNPAYHLVWQRVFFTQDHISFGLGPVYALFLGVFILVVGLLFDYVRRVALEKPLFYLLKKPLDGLQTKIDGIFLG
jgi:surface polysaccharide O-acyltransferase-like enzyme